MVGDGIKPNVSGHDVSNEEMLYNAASVWVSWENLEEEKNANIIARKYYNSATHLKENVLWKGWSVEVDLTYIKLMLHLKYQGSFRREPLNE